MTIGILKVRLAAKRPVAGGVRVPFKYFQSTFPGCAGRNSRTQSRALPGPPATVTVTFWPGQTVEDETEQLSGAPPVKSLGLLQSPVAQALRPRTHHRYCARGSGSDTEQETPVHFDSEAYQAAWTLPVCMFLIQS